MLIVNLLNGVFLASLVSFIIGAVLLAIGAGRSSGAAGTYQARVLTAFNNPRFRIGRTLVVAGGAFAVASCVAVFVLSASLPRCAASPDNIDEAVAMCMPVAATPAA